MRNGLDRFGKRSRGRAASRRVLLCALVALTAACAFMLAGCKYSDVLTQHTVDPDAGIDEGVDPEYQSNPDAELELDLANLSLDAAEDQDTQVAMLPHYDPDSPDNGPTKQLKKSNATPHDEEASEGDDDGEPDREGNGEGENGGEATNNSSGDGEGQDEGDGEKLQDDDSDEATESDTGGAGNDTVVVDPDGTNDDTTKGTIAAVGEYATIAQMLGGAGALVACDQTWLDARNADGCFSGELSRVQVAFTGDGTAAGSCDVATLTGALKPSVVLWDSTANAPNLSESERATLEAAGIAIQPVPHIGEQTTEDYGVKTAVSEVASVLSGASGLQYDPADVLAQYTEFHDGALKACYDANSGYSYKVTDSSYDQIYQNTALSDLTNSTTNRVVTVYVDSLMNAPVSSATVAQTATVTGGVVELAHNGSTLDISDGVGLSAATSTRAYMVIDYYLQLAGAMNNAYDTAQPEAQGRRYILMPGSTAAFGTSSAYASRSTGSAFFYNGGDGSVAGNWHALGDADFKMVLTANSDIADAIVASAAKSNGLYRMESPYNVAVVPSGIAGSWTGGHIDSFLFAPWALRIQSEDNLDAAASYASSFYTKFLRCSNWQSAVADWDTSRVTAGG